MPKIAILAQPHLSVCLCLHSALQRMSEGVADFPEGKMKNDLLSVCRDILLPVVFLLPSFLLTCRRRRRRRQTCYARKTHVRPSLTRLDYTRLTRAARAASAVHAVTAVHERVNPLRRCGDLRMRVCGILGHRLSSFSILSLLLPSSLFPLPSSLFPSWAPLTNCLARSP